MQSHYITTPQSVGFRSISSRLSLRPLLRKLLQDCSLHVFLEFPFPYTLHVHFAFVCYVCACARIAFQYPDTKDEAGFWSVKLNSETRRKANTVASFKVNLRTCDSLTSTKTKDPCTKNRLGELCVKIQYPTV